MAFPFFGKKQEARDISKGEDTVFRIDTAPHLVSLPRLEERTKINARYPLIAPFAYAHIYWDEKAKELVYDVEEPVLTDTELEFLKLVQLALEEMINISFVKAVKMTLVIKYLERNVQSILKELGAKITAETYKKIMYFVYRDSVGFNEIDPIINDYFVEDIECNGFNTPIYIVHRKYQNMRTNVIYKEPQQLTNFVEKLAQRAGRYVSYAKPLLDGTLPDGSRVNATYTADVTTRGPTFTIRKFTKEPWTPMHLIDQRTAPAEVFAYFWLVIQYKFNIMVIGETASGKTTFLNSVMNFIPPEARVVSIEDTRELNLAHENWLPSVTRTGFGIPNILGQQYGEITLFDLLRETFRQNPDYVILGETRGEETYVLFQGMASGHPSFSTFHSASIEALVRRLSTAPINLSPSLIESLDVIAVVTHVKTLDKNIRRMRELNEIITVEENNKVASNTVFKWDPIKDVISFSGNSVMLEKISRRTGISVKDLQKEMKTRAVLIQKMYDQKIFDFKKVNEIINAYYKDPNSVLRRFNITGKAVIAEKGKGMGKKSAKITQIKGKEKQRKLRERKLRKK